MPDANWENLKKILHAAVAHAPAERRGYLDRACDGNADTLQASRTRLTSDLKESLFKMRTGS